MIYPFHLLLFVSLPIIRLLVYWMWYGFFFVSYCLFTGRTYSTSIAQFLYFSNSSML